MRRLVDYPRAGKRGVRRFIPSWRLVLGTGFTVSCLFVIGFCLFYASVPVPDPNQAVTSNASVVYWADGKTELGRFGVVDRRSIPISQVPQSMQKAVLAAEDRSFYDNHGISPRGIGRAVWVKLHGGSTQGGSTITQQYVKNYYLTQDRTAQRKAHEFVISLKIEQQQSKDRILENYLNTIYFGRGTYGVESASLAYFGHPASKLTPAESALLAAIIRSPGLYDPIKHKPQAQARVQYVLDGMVQQGWLDPADRAKIGFPKVLKPRTENYLGGTNGYLLSSVRSEVVRETGMTDADIDRGGLKIVSTFDQRLQKAAVDAMDEKLPTENAKGVGAGLVAMKPGDGAVVAMYGGKDYVKAPFNQSTQARVRAGSTFKPFTLTAALEDGISLRTRYDGHSPQSFPGFEKPVRNFGGEQPGRIDLVKATEDSVNTVYVQLNLAVGPDKSKNAAIRAGYPKDTQDLDSTGINVLGPASPHVIDVADAYATFAAQGMRAPAYMLRSVTRTDGTVVYQAKPQPKRVFDEDVMSDVSYALQNVVKHGTGHYASTQIDRPLAGKTGTSSGSLSAWFAGYSPQLAVAVGLHRGGKTADGKPAELTLNTLGGIPNVTGGTVPLNIWTAFMEAALDGQKVEQFPEPAYVGKNGGPISTSTSTPTSRPSTSSSTTTTAPTTTAPPTTTSTPTVTRTTTRPTASPTTTRQPTPTVTVPTQPPTPTVPPSPTLSTDEPTRKR